jgi:hypothetical protein
LEPYLRQIRQEWPHIKPFEEEEDIYWWDEGMEALQANELLLAEAIFKKLIVAQPEHFDGYEGLAQVYQRRGWLPQARLFADEALRLAQAFLHDGSLDPIAMQDLRDYRAQLGDDDSPPA